MEKIAVIAGAGPAGLTAAFELLQRSDVRPIVFESDGQRAGLRQVGNVDECKELIELILEGGREAFLQRKARYGH